MEWQVIDNCHLFTNYELESLNYVAGHLFIHNLLRSAWAVKTTRHCFLVPIPKGKGEPFEYKLILSTMIDWHWLLWFRVRPNGDLVRSQFYNMTGGPQRRYVIWANFCRTTKRVNLVELMSEARGWPDRSVCPIYFLELLEIGTVLPADIISINGNDWFISCAKWSERTLKLWSA